MRWFVMLCSVFVVSVWTAPRVHACSCIPNPPPREAFEQAGLVFAGRVLDIRDASEAEYPGSLDVTLEVERPFKGVFIETIKVRTARHSASCGFPFEEGERYLVYTDASDDGVVRASLCSRTASLLDARDDLIVFDALDLLEPEMEEDGGRCGGLTNAAAMQAALFVFLLVAFQRRRYS